MADIDTQTLLGESKPTHQIPLDAIRDSKIVHINLYSGLAEVTRLFKVRVNGGLNELVVSGFTDCLKGDSVRLDSRGSITIHDVSVSRVNTTPPAPQTSSETIALEHQKNQIENSLTRCRKSLEWLEKYLNSIDVKSIGDITKVGEVAREYRKATEEVQEEILGLEKRKEGVEEELKRVVKVLKEPKEDRNRRNRMKVVVVKEGGEGDVEIFVKYSVNNATWNAAYDIRVNLQPGEKQKPVTIVYKAAIVQSTDEPWDDVQLSLETASPTHNLQLPTLQPWNLTVYKKPLPSSSGSAAPRPGSIMRAPMRAMRSVAARTSVIEADTALDEEEESSDEDMGFGAAVVSSKGNVNATYTIPGTVSVPSDGVVHKVTVVQLQLDAEFEWVCVPKRDTRVHIKAKVKNASDYTLFPGQASNYVDGSFISTSYQPLISPQETFPCSLGIDPSIRITYHPLSKEESKSGFVSKSNDKVFIQRLTIKNTKTVAIPRLRVHEQIPVSQDVQISVKMVVPALTLPLALVPASSSSSGPTTMKGELKRPQAVKVQSGGGGGVVTAQWDGTDDSSVDVEAVGRNGRLNWVCVVNPQETVNLTLQYEVSAPSQVVVLGL
ncbi:hypothetical protein BDN72DRAFT_775200 [Pluteus cervinus]|uniref:Uncharacterized protein n=1 Tax=Pluteus cervinus TaxID=181527 RepID=A0ACD3AGM9_9AGAR|nr:hypothetical protein BDN72DRAFT_775200 [Pluteus cervinus]